MQPLPSLDKIAAQIPRNLSGVERQRQIADLVNQLPAQEAESSETRTMRVVLP